MAFDTGATITFMKSDMLKDLEYNEKCKDFYPGIGEFETPIYNISGYINEQRIPLKCGVLPSQLEKTLTVFGIEGIIGYDLLQAFVIILSIRNKALYYIPHIVYAEKVKAGNNNNARQ